MERNEAFGRLDGFGKAIARVITIGGHQDRAAGPYRIGMLALDLVELAAGLEPILGGDLLPGVIVDLLDRTLDIDRRVLVVLGAADKEEACRREHQDAQGT